MENKFEYVDLGLTSGTLWANQNLPGYYAFGEFKEKESYTLDNSITFYKDKKKLILEGLCDYKGNIISNHSFSIPTKEQFLELMSECTWKWDNDLLGYTITSNKNNNSIFLGTEGYKLKTDGTYYKYSLLKMGENYVVENILPSVNDEQKILLETFKRKITSIYPKQLLKYVYSKYPDYTTKSLIKDEVLDDE